VIVQVPDVQKYILQFPQLDGNVSDVDSSDDEDDQAAKPAAVSSNVAAGLHVDSESKLEWKPQAVAKESEGSSNNNDLALSGVPTQSPVSQQQLNVPLITTNSSTESKSDILLNSSNCVSSSSSPVSVHENNDSSATTNNEQFSSPKSHEPEPELETTSRVESASPLHGKDAAEEDVPNSGVSIDDCSTTKNANFSDHQIPEQSTEKVSESIQKPSVEKVFEVIEAAKIESSEIVSSETVDQPQESLEQSFITAKPVIAEPTEQSISVGQCETLVEPLPVIEQPQTTTVSSPESMVEQPVLKSIESLQTEVQTPSLPTDLESSKAEQLPLSVQQTDVAVSESLEVVTADSFKPFEAPAEVKETSQQEPSDSNCESQDLEVKMTEASSPVPSPTSEIKKSPEEPSEIEPSVSILENSAEASNVNVVYEHSENQKSETVTEQSVTPATEPETTQEITEAVTVELSVEKSFVPVSTPESVSDESLLEKVEPTVENASLTVHDEQVTSEIVQTSLQDEVSESAPLQIEKFLSVANDIGQSIPVQAVTENDQVEQDASEVEIPVPV